MGESHGTALILKRHEDLAKVAAYVKQQVREKSIEQVGEDLSEDSEYVGLRINEDENTIIWHDYGYHGDHLIFDSIGESVIKEFPGVEMECQQWYGQDGWNYLIVDGEWREYTLWKFVAYIDGKGEEVQLEYKELKEDGRTEEEKHEERDKMCKEIAERLSRSHPDVEIAVYVYDWYEIEGRIEEFYKVKNGHVTKERLSQGLSLLTYNFLDHRAYSLLHPKEFAIELIKRAREGDMMCLDIAIEILEYDDTASLIGPADKKLLMELKLKHEEELSRWDSDDLPF